MAKRVFLHVGTPKTGTSALQDALFHNPEALAEHDLLYPATRFDEQFLAALDLMRMQWGGLEHQARGKWESIARQVREHPGDAIISHEILAVAQHPSVRRARESLGAAELHVVVSVRDLIRQIPAEWQENIKHRSTLTYADFLAGIRSPDREGRIPSWFWQAQEYPDILDRWAYGLPPEQVHVITVPQQGAPPDALWQRFVEAFELADVQFGELGDRANPSMGAGETALVRAVNAGVRNVPGDHYRPLVRELLAHQTLARRTSTAKLSLPPEHRDWAQDLTMRWRDIVAERGYRVVGDLADLNGPEPSAHYVDPDAPTVDDVLPAAVDAIAALVEQAIAAENREARMHGEVEHLRHIAEAAEAGPALLATRARRRVGRTKWGGRAARLYRGARARSSRPA